MTFMLRPSFAGFVGFVLMGLPCSAGLDLDSDGMSDLWETQFAATSLAGNLDTDGDGQTNALEALAGTDPFSPESRLELLSTWMAGGVIKLDLASTAGKQYQIRASDEPGISGELWQSVAGTGQQINLSFAAAAFSRQFFRLSVADADLDSDGLTDGEESTLAFDPRSSHTDRQNATDLARAQSGWNAANVITVGLLDGLTSERWPDPGLIAIRRSGGLKPVTVQFSLTGTAIRDVDYTLPAGNSITLPAGAREAWVSLAPIADALDAEGDETIVLTVVPGSGYSLGTGVSATVVLQDEPAGALPSAKAAARFLMQAAFGPDQDSAADPDMIPENVETMMSQGYSAWLDEQFAIPPQYHEPFVANAATIPQMYLDPKMVSWWNRALGTTALYPGGPAAQYDPVRQRFAYCLSQIFVVSDRPEMLAVEFRGMANYYDMLVRNALGNFRTLLYEVATHPVMGFYLSHAKNRKGNPAANVFPDENFAREVMQLFSIGLWQLNPDGSRKLEGGQPIPTYTNVDITNFARVFTGLSYGPASQTNFDAYPNPPQWIVPMRGFDTWHDLAPKTLLNGITLPARTASVPDTGTATMLDVNAAMDNLFMHPNTGPFIARLLIQRMVTSNPSPAYIGRVSAAFADNGAGVRGDMKALLKAILLDPEARDPAALSNPSWGKAREPFLRCVNFARAFNARSSGVDFYQVSQFNFDQQQQPYNSPSVFNFFLPNYTPPGVVGEAGLVAPEFQILNATTAVSSPNYFYFALANRDLHRWGTADPARTVRPDFTQETALAVSDVDALIRRLDLHLTYGTLTPREFQSIREALLRVTAGVAFDWQTQRVNLALYLILTSPEYCIQR